MSQQHLLLIPYGKTSYENIISRGFAYVDKTKYIEILEQSNTDYAFILRPRRFGKTLFTDTLQCYYDRAYSKKFTSLFANTYIGSHKTPMQGSCYVLKFDFSGINKDPDAIKDSFNAKVAQGLRRFALSYNELKEQVLAIIDKKFDSPATMLGDFCDTILPITGTNVFLIIDEYDQFANDLLSNDIHTFRLITSSEGFLKDFYAIIKERTRDIFLKVYITGVSSISLDSMTSGFNIADNISFIPQYAGIFGFTEEELRTLIYQTIDLNKVGKSIDDILLTMKDYFNGYRFSSQSQISVSNPSMCLYYLNILAKTNEEPITLFDPNTTSDIYKIKGILSLSNFGSQIKEIVDCALNGSDIPMYSQPTTLNINAMEKLNYDDLLSVLIYMGYLTWSKESNNQLCCPNKAMREQFFKYYFKMIDSHAALSFEKNSMVDEAYAEIDKGNLKPLISYVAIKLSLESSFAIATGFNEHCVQIATLMAFIANTKYQVFAEQEAFGKGRSDLFIEEKDSSSPDKRCFLVEFKYLKKSDADEHRVKMLAENAKAQLLRYQESETYKHLTKLKKVVAVFAGTSLAYFEEC